MDPLAGLLGATHTQIAIAPSPEGRGRGKPGTGVVLYATHALVGKARAHVAPQFSGADGVRLGFRVWGSLAST